MAHRPAAARLRASTLAALMLAALLAWPTAAQSQPASNGKAKEAAAKPAEAGGPVAVPVASIVVRASSLDATIRAIEANWEEPESQAKIAEQLPQMKEQVHVRAARLADVLAKSYDRGDLDSQQATWRGIEAELASWQATLSRRLETLNDQRNALREKQEVWKKTAGTALADKAPAEVREVVATAERSLRKADKSLRRARDTSLALQRGVVDLQSRAQAQLDSLVAARENVLRHLLSRNSSLPWELEVGELDDNRESFWFAINESRASIHSYSQKQEQRLTLHGLFMFFLIVVAVRARRGFLALQEAHQHPLPPALFHPIAAAFVLGMTMTVWVHPDAPPHFGQLAAVIVLPFWFFVLRSLLPETLKAPLIGFLLLVPLEFIRHLAVSFDLLSRGMLVIEAAAYFGGILWLRRPSRIGSVPVAENPFWTRLLGAWLHVAGIAAGIAFVGAVSGWTTLADLALTAVAGGSFAASILFTAVRVAEDLAEGSTHAGMLRRVRTIHHQPEAFLGIVRNTGRVLALATWVYLLLDNLGIQNAFMEALRGTLATPIGYGNVQVTFGGIIAFGVAIWVSWLLSRFVATVLEGEVLSRFVLPRGVPFALSTISRYVILVLGFVMAIAALGVEVGNLALLVSALGVGIGFGMQNIVNNFISGLILLFERPIKVGDLVSLEDQLMGDVKSIGIRASIVRTFDGADVIVPNGDLISNRVTNWTLADTRRRIILPIGVVYGTPARHVMELLLGVAEQNPDVLGYPKPMALFVGFGDSSLDFELRAWTESEDALTLVRSDLAVAVQDALAAADIEVPFPQRDLHLKTLPPPHGRGPDGAS